MTRYLLLLIALTTGVYAVAMWMCGQLTDAGIAAATSAAAVLLAEFAAFCQRRQWRSRYHDELIRGIEEGVLPSEAYRGVWDWTTGAPE